MSDTGTVGLPPRWRSVALEELNLPYVTHPVNVRAGKQFGDEFHRLNPNDKVPVIRNDELGLVLSESCAILMTSPIVEAR